MVRHGVTYSTNSMGFVDGDTLHLAAFFNGNRNISTLGYNVSSIPYNPYTGFMFYSTGVLSTNKWSFVISLPFSFQFFGCNYNKLRIGENGIISFDSTLTSTSVCPNVITGTAPNVNIPKASIMGVFQDLNISSSSIVTYTPVGTFPCRKFIIDITSAPYFSTTCSATVTAKSQIILYEGSNIIDIHVGRQNPCSATNSGRAIIGIQNKDQTIAYTAPGKNNTTFTATNTSWRFTPADTPSTIRKVVLFDGIHRIDSIVPTYSPYPILRADFNREYHLPPGAALKAVMYSTYPDLCGGTGGGGTGSGSYATSTAADATNTMNFDICDLTTSVTPNDAFIYCDGSDQIGAVSAVPTTTHGPCAYLWSTGSNLNTFDAFGGTYTVTVTDAIGCTASSSGTIDEYFDYVDGIFSTSTNSTCNQANGSMLIRPTTFYNQTSAFIPINIQFFNDDSGIVYQSIDTRIGRDTLVTGLPAGSYTLIYYFGSVCNGSYSPFRINNTITPKLRSLSYNLCPGTSVNVGYHTYSSAGIFKDTIIASTGCDSIITTTITLVPSFTINQTRTLCAGASYTINGHTYTTAGLKRDTLHTIYGCDSIVNTTIVVTSTSPVTINQTRSFCQGGSYTINGHTYTTAGLRRDTLHTISGCDSIVNTTIVVNPVFTIAQTVIICPGGSYIFNGHTYTTGGLKRDTLNSIHGCDSIINTTVFILTLAPVTVNQTRSICPGDSYTINGHTYTTPGLRRDTLNTYRGCDSIVNTTILFLPTNTVSQTVSICLGDSYTINGHTYTTAGLKRDTLVNRYGCDSVVNTTISILPNSARTTFITICEGRTYVYRGHTYRLTTTIRDTLTNYRGCDSFYTINLTVLATTISTRNVNLCPGESYTFNGHTYTTAGYHNDTLFNANSRGCDSIVYTFITLRSNYTFSRTVIICSGQSYTFNGHTYTTAGLKRDTLNTIYGCDSVINTTLIINPTNTINQTINICPGSSYSINGHTYTTAGLKRDTFDNIYGCDSIVNTTINLLPTPSVYQTINLCNDSSYSINGHIYSSTGLYSDTFTTYLGCDSIIYTAIIISNDRDSIGASICFGDSVLINGIYYSIPGIYYDTVSSSLGCDSLLTIEISAFEADSINLNDTIICRGTSIFGTTPLHDTLFTFHYTNILGCDSIETQRVRVKICSGIENITDQKILLYPNPTNSIINIELEQLTEETYIEIVDANSKLVYSEHLRYKSTLIDLSKYESGVYLIKVTNQQGTNNYKIFKY